MTVMILTLGACAGGGGDTTTVPTTTDVPDSTTPEDTTPADTTTADVTTGKGEGTVPLDKNKEYSVLFIGNSYTHYNSINVVFKAIAASAGYKVNSTAITKGSWYLAYHADENDEMGSRSTPPLKIINTISL